MPHVMGRIGSHELIVLLLAIVQIVWCILTCWKYTERVQLNEVMMTPERWGSDCSEREVGHKIGVDFQKVCSVLWH